MRPGHTIYVRVMCIVFVLAAHINARSQTLHWVKQLGSKDWDEGVAIATDGSGNVYSIGNFSDTLDLDPGPGIFNLVPYGMKDVFVSKLDANGNFIWAKQIGGNGWEECTAIAVDNNGNVYITGSFLGTTDFDPAATTFNLTCTAADINAFICKLDSSGSFVWAKQIGGTRAVNSYAITVDNGGNVYTTGYFDATADLDPGPGFFNLTALAYSDIFVSRLDASGNFVWAKQFAGAQSGEVGYAIAVDGSGNVYTTGTFTATVDFDPGPGAFNLSTSGAGDKDIFVSKLDASGNLVWVRQLGGEEAHGIAVDNTGNVYVGGSGYYAWNGIAIHKLGPSGNSIWAKEIMAYGCTSLAIDAAHNVYTTGPFFGNKDFDPGPGTFNLIGGNSDSYISKLDSAGQFAWAKLLGGTDQVWSQCVAVGGNDIVYTIGYFGAIADFDPAATTYNLTSVGSYDVFIHKLKPDNLGVGETPLNEAFKIYPNPTNGKFVIEFRDGCKASNIVLRNLMGQVVAQRAVKSSDHIQLDITGPSGTYILEVFDQNGLKAIARIVKN